MTINNLHRDLSFLDKGIIISNKAKRENHEVRDESKVTKASKNLKYFLRKSRGIQWKQLAP